MKMVKKLLGMGKKRKTSKVRTPRKKNGQFKKKK